MYRKQINEQSPLRILEKSSHGGLGRGNLGVVMARAGVGKTTFLVHIALDDLMRDRKVLHVSLDTPVDHVRSWYDAVFQDIARTTHMEDAAATLEMVNRNRIIQATSKHGHGSSGAFSLERLVSNMELLKQHMNFVPDVIILDALDWTQVTAEEGQQLRALAKLHNVELWTTAIAHRRDTGAHPTQVPPPCDRCLDVIDIVIFLEPVDHHLSVRLLKDHGNKDVVDTTHLVLYPDTMRLVDDRSPHAMAEDVPVEGRTLLSGGASGAEAEFGACAERWGMKEENFSFEGHQVSRSRGLKLLTEAELKDGDVSLAYVSATMHRTYHSNPAIRKVLQSIWHQVRSAGEVFIVGTIQRDDTVRGGTGWAAELARHQGKPVHVFDQERQSWFTWSTTQRAWAPSKPTIEQSRFTGTGTRTLTPEGKAAITELFRRSFGPPAHR